MTEREYIHTKALGTINAALSTLRELVPDNMPDVIKEGEHSSVFSTLCDWQDRLYLLIKTTGK